MRIEPQIAPADFALIRGLVATLTFVMSLVRAQRTTLRRLRRLFGFTSSEKTDDVLGPHKESDSPEEQSGVDAKTEADPAAGADAAGGAVKEAGADDAGANDEPEKDKAKGHGRIPAADYEAATQIAVAHECLAPGSRCPQCGRGTLYDLKEPARLLRIVGQPVLAAVCWNCQRLRCSGCGDVFTARAPKEAQGPKFDETAISMLALCRYSAGLPHNRLDRLQRHLQTPVPSSTQWDVLDESGPTFQPVFEEMVRQAAQGEVIHDDDSYVRILALMGNRRAELLKKGELPDPERTGLFTTAIVSLTDGQPIALFYTGRKYAGENLADLLKAREADLEPPILMSDGLRSRNVPKGHKVIECNCNAHARRGIVDQVPNFPAECAHVLEELRKIFVVEARCRKENRTGDERLQIHKEQSGPVMAALHVWMTAELDAKRVEPNSGLGRAYKYMLKRWDKLTLFLRQAGAPIDNNICERTLKKAICHRRNSLFYRSEHGAQLGDMFMSLIHTAELRGANPFDYLTEVQRHAKAAAERPADWLPWTYRDTLARLAEHPSSSSASPSSTSSASPPMQPLATSPPPAPRCPDTYESAPSQISL